MNGFKNEYTLNVDIKRETASPVPIFKRGDTAVLKFRIFDDGDLYDLTGFVRAELTQVLPSGTAISGEAQLEDGLIVYRYSKEEMLEIGKIITSLTIYDQNDNQVSVQPFAVHMYDEMDGKTLSYIGVLQDLIAQVKIIDKQTKELLGFIEENMDILTDIIPNEQERIQSENERIENENTRKHNENQRIDSENIRISNEEERIQNENERKTSEQNRINEENIRIENENNRNTNESERIYKEIVRENNESVRISNEQSREDNEYQRIQNENERIEHENERILKEGERIQNELQRQQNEQNRETIFNSQIEAINNVLPNVEGLENRLSWNSTTQYFKNNIVERNGNSYQALKDNVNQPPPTPPEKTNEFWQLIAQRGVDGTGSVSSVNRVSPNLDGNVELTPYDIGTYSKDEIEEKIFNRKIEEFISSENQSLFILTQGTYEVGKNQLKVFVGGVEQYSALGHFIEVSEGSFELSESIPSGISVIAIY